jgi:hypothetical protein
MGRNIQPWWGKNSIENKGKSWNYGKEYPTLVGEIKPQIIKVSKVL